MFYTRPLQSASDTSTYGINHHDLMRIYCAHNALTSSISVVVVRSLVSSLICCASHSATLSSPKCISYYSQQIHYNQQKQSVYSVTLPCCDSFTIVYACMYAETKTINIRKWFIMHSTNRIRFLFYSILCECFSVKWQMRLSLRTNKFSVLCVCVCMLYVWNACHIAVTSVQMVKINLIGPEFRVCNSKNTG